MVGVARNAYALSFCFLLGAAMTGGLSSPARAQAAQQNQVQPLPPVQVEAPNAHKRASKGPPAPGHDRSIARGRGWLQ